MKTNNHDNLEGNQGIRILGYDDQVGEMLKYIFERLTLHVYLMNSL
jgi:hypothetical protein